MRAQRRAGGPRRLRRRRRRAALARARDAGGRRRARVELVGRCEDEGVPLLGVCLGHQAIARRVRRDGRPGPGAAARQDQRGRSTTAPACCAGLPRPFTATRYHSLAVEEADPAARARGHRAHAGRRRHGAAAPRPAGRGRAVPPGVGAHAGRPPLLPAGCAQCGDTATSPSWRRARARAVPSDWPLRALTSPGARSGRGGRRPGRRGCRRRARGLVGVGVGVGVGDGVGRRGRRRLRHDERDGAAAGRGRAGRVLRSTRPAARVVLQPDPDVEAGLLQRRRGLLLRQPTRAVRTTLPLATTRVTCCPAGSGCRRRDRTSRAPRPAACCRRARSRRPA